MVFVQLQLGSTSISNGIQFNFEVKNTAHSVILARWRSLEETSITVKMNKTKRGEMSKIYELIISLAPTNCECLYHVQCSESSIHSSENYERAGVGEDEIQMKNCNIRMLQVSSVSHFENFIFSFSGCIIIVDGSATNANSCCRSLFLNNIFRFSSSAKINTSYSIVNINPKMSSFSSRFSSQNFNFSFSLFYIATINIVFISCKLKCEFRRTL